MKYVEGGYYLCDPEDPRSLDTLMEAIDVTTIYRDWRKNISDETIESLWHKNTGISDETIIRECAATIRNKMNRILEQTDTKPADTTRRRLLRKVRSLPRAEDEF